MRFKKIEVTDPNGHKTEFLKDIDTGKLYKRTGLVPRDFPGCQIVEEPAPSGCEWCKFRLRASNEDPCRTCSHNFIDNFEMGSEVRDV